MTRGNTGDIADSERGQGQRLFNDDDTLQVLELLDVQQSAKGSLFLTHQSLR